jgi:hypothetical protein
MYMEAVLMTEFLANGTFALTRAQDPFPYFSAPQWKEPAADPIADALRAAGEAANLLDKGAKDAARAVLSLLRELPDPSVVVEDDEITIEWYKDRHHVAVFAVDGHSISWAVMAGQANPLNGKELFDNEIPDEAYAAVSAAIG